MCGRAPCMRARTLPTSHGPAARARDWGSGRRRSHGLAAPWGDLACKSKVDELELGVLSLVLIDEVIQLDVSVHHSMVVAVDDRGDDLLHDRRRRSLAVPVPVRLHPGDLRSRARVGV